MNAGFRPSRAILELGDSFYDPVRPADFPQTALRFRNDRAAAAIGLEALDDAAWLRHFGRFEPLPGSLAGPLALRYHGHQFRTLQSRPRRRPRLSVRAMPLMISQTGGCSISAPRVQRPDAVERAPPMAA